MSTKTLTAAIKIGQTETISQHTQGGCHFAEVNLDKYGWALIAFLAKICTALWCILRWGMRSSAQQPLDGAQWERAEHNAAVARQIVANYPVESESKLGNSFSIVVDFSGNWMQFFLFTGLVWTEYIVVEIRINAICQQSCKIHRLNMYEDKMHLLSKSLSPSQYSEGANAFILSCLAVNLCWKL